MADEFTSPYDVSMSEASLFDLAKDLIYKRGIVEIENQRTPAPSNPTDNGQTQTQQGQTRPNQMNKAADFVRENQQTIILGFTGLLVAGLILNAVK